jgi:polysaccharide pyruvyl transferase WcaK-like protein
MLGKPVLAIAYCRKTSDLMHDLGIGEYSLDIQHLALEDIQRKFTQLERHRHEIAAMLRARVAEYQRALGEQYERVFSRYRS